MKSEVRQIVAALNEASVRYVVAGGLAVVAHGYLRLTMDVDLIVDLERENLLCGLRVLGGLGYKPRLPASIEQFADADVREQWIREKNMLVFPLWRSEEPHGMVIDIFVRCPFNFSEEYEKAKWMELDDGEKIPFVGLECLLKMKKEAGRPKDMDDIEHLKG